MTSFSVGSVEVRISNEPKNVPEIADHIIRSFDGLLGSGWNHGAEGEVMAVLIEALLQAQSIIIKEVL